MEYICLVPSEKAKEAERKLKEDFDIAAKQSIAIRNAETLGIKESGVIFFIRGTDEGVKRCKEILASYVKSADAKTLNLAKEKIIEDEEKAASGFGNIFG